jgi:hypothetical protein
LGELCGLDRLRYGADLVDLKKEAIACLLLDCRLDTYRIGDRQIIANDLDAALFGEMRPGFPVILVEGILDGDNGVFLGQCDIQVC